MNGWTRKQFLLEPGMNGAAGGGLAAIADDATMDAVFDRLNLPKELRGEKPAAKAGAKTVPKAAAAAAAEVEPEPETEAEPEAETEETPEAEPETEGAEPEPEAEESETAEPTVETVTAELETVRTEKAELEARLAELEAEVETTKDRPVEVAPVHPLFLLDDDAKVAEYVKTLRSFEDWALQNWDGVEAVTDEATGKVTSPGYSKEAIRKRYGQVKSEREELVPAAAQLRAFRKQQTDLAKKEYPELFNPKSKEYATARAILARAPGLKAVLPNIWTVIGDALVGEKLRMQKAQAAAGKAKAGKPGVKAATPNAGKPAGLRPGPGKGTAARKPGNEPSAKRFMELGGNRGALVEMLKSVNVPTVRRAE